MLDGQTSRSALFSFPFPSSRPPSPPSSLPPSHTLTPPLCLPASQPNYPGRSSHLCNGGFVVPTHHRGLRVGHTLGRSYLHFAPLLGYRGSVFNLVYVSNVASVKIWDSLGFQRVGLVPGAGRLEGEEGYVDAIVFYYDFMKKKGEKEQ